MLQKMIDGTKRLLIGYGFLLSLVLIGLSFGLPSVGKVWHSPCSPLFSAPAR